MKSLFKYLREELEVDIPKAPKKLPYVPSEEVLKRYYNSIWESKNFQDIMIVKVFLYTGVRVSELINIKISDIDFQERTIRVNEGKGKKDRLVLFPDSFKEILAMHVNNMNEKNAKYLFESSWNKKYTDRGMRKVFEKYSIKAGLEQNLSPHKMRHFLFTWLKKQGIDDALILPISGHESRKTLEIYSKLSLKDTKEVYDEVIHKFPI
jgi:integrase/recombinase XerD